MHKVLILGAGMVSRPIIRYLLEQTDIFVTVADMFVEKAKKIIQNHPNGRSLYLDVSDDESLQELIADADLVVSILPYMYHVKVAKLCIKNKKHLVTTSYVLDEMRKLDADARNAGVLLLNECGLDPGLDHMSAMRIIHQVEENGGKIVSFKSTTGALPAHEANTNPFVYKFSWSPRGVLLASRNSATWLENGKIIEIPGSQLFEHYSIKDIPAVGAFEDYPNRNSVLYKDIYDLKDAQTVYRGTFRFVGWCETLLAISKLGWLQETPLESFSASTYRDVTKKLINAKDTDNLIEKVSEFLGLYPYSAVIKRLKWIGIFDDKELPAEKNTPLDYLTNLMLEKMPLDENQRDMVVMHHEFITDYDGKKEHITSTLVQYGMKEGDTAVSRTVALPAAIAVKMILNNTITLKGVHIPIQPEIYTPILKELESMNVVFKERFEPIITK